MVESNFSALKLRIITGALLIFFVAFLWSIGSYGMFILVCMLSVIGQMEFCNFFLEKEKIKERFVAILLGLSYVFFVFFGHSSSGVSNVIFIMAFLIVALFSLVDFSQEKALDHMKNAAVILISFMYLPVIYSLLLGFTPVQQILIICIPIASDTAAYFAGISFGNRRIWPAVSPKKSLEGCAVGLLASTIVVLFFGLSFEVLATNSILVLIFMGIFLGVMTQMGDFFESALKRSMNIKDSGTILPGHGGVLDRTDSLIFTIASFEICTMLLKHAS